jgi:hypothetical protein
MKDIERAWSMISHQIALYRAEKKITIPEIDRAVSILGDFVWELGPYLDTEQLGFALSPGWDRRLLYEAECIIDTAPDLEGVVFLAAKPPKKWNGKFQLDTGTGLLEVYATQIGFELQSVNVSELEIAITLDSILEPWKGDVVNIFIDSEIGEYNKIIHIPWCDINAADGPSEGNRSAPFALRRRFFAQFPHAPYATDVLRLMDQ